MINEQLELLVSNCDICIIDGCSLYHGYDDILIDKSPKTIIVEPSYDKFCEIVCKYPNVKVINGLLSSESKTLKDKCYNDNKPSFIESDLVEYPEKKFDILGIEEFLDDKNASRAAIIIKRNRGELLENLTVTTLSKINLFLLCDFEELEPNFGEYLLANGFVLQQHTDEKMGRKDYLFSKSSFIRKIRDENSALKKEKEKLIAQLQESNHRNIKLDLDIISLRRKYLNEIGNTSTVCGHRTHNKVLRVLRHFACSGGTLYSKCLSAMPNNFLLSEVYPYNPFPESKPKYSPTNLVELARYSGFPELEECQNTIFCESIIKCHEHIEKYGGSLILREHTHADYCVGSEIKHDTVGSILIPYFDRIINVVTIRNPIDSYLSLVHNKWQHFPEANFENYCFRLKKFTEKYSNEEIYLYEDFIENPKNEMKAICERFEIEYDEAFIDNFGSFKVTGDSGRGSNSISPRERRALNDEFKIEIETSLSFKQLCERDIFNRYKE